MGIDIFTHNNGVIHQDSQGHDKGKKGDHVNGLIKPVEHHEGPHECNRYPDGYPEGQAQIQKKGQGDKNQHYTLKTVAQH
jgi:hypothetical protein